MNIKYGQLGPNEYETARLKETRIISKIQKLRKKLGLSAINGLESIEVGMDETLRELGGEDGRNN